MDKMTKNAEKNLNYFCNICEFICSKQSNYEKHLLTSKHKNRTNLNNLEQKMPENAEKLFICKKCNKEYKVRNSLWYHEKTCNFEKDKTIKDIVLEIIKQNNNNIITNEEPIQNQSGDKELINYLIKENQEFKNLILEIVKKDNITNNNNITHTNSHNKSFNLNFFLNETCKNAMNINEFVDSIKLQLSDLENVAKIGYVEGLSKIIIKNLNALDVTERPIHCSDSKRDTMYVKDEDKWEKESENNEKVLKAIEDIANKNRKMVKEWKIKNPECASSKSHKADVYSHIMIQAVCSNNDANNTKILKKLAKEVTIDKH